MRWSEAVTLEFIKIYLRHECLWSPTHPGYKLKYLRDKAYADICTEFETSTRKVLSVPEVKMKIKNLRTTYLQQVQKILQKSSPDCIYEPTLVWFREMDRCFKHVPTHRHLPNQDITEVDPSYQIWSTEELKNNNEENPDPLISDEEYNFPKSEDLLSPTKKHNKSLLMVATKKKKLKHKASKECFPEVYIEDEFDVYGKYIATQLRNMELVKAIRLQLEIQSLLSEARISDMTDT